MLVKCALYGLTAQVAQHTRGTFARREIIIFMIWEDLVHHAASRVDPADVGSSSLRMAAKVDRQLFDMVFCIYSQPEAIMEKIKNMY